MQIFENNSTVSTVYHRYISLTISKEYAEQRNGKVFVSDHQNSEQTNRRRELLAVEEEANKNKIIEEHGQTHFKAQMMDQFFGKVNKKLNIEFDNKENLYNNVINIEDAAPAILEILCLKAASIKRISPLINSLSWLSRDLISLVNKPQYRKRADVKVSDPNLAISYVGLDNLKLLMPTFILKHWLPVSTTPYSLMKRKLWNDSLSIALASSVLAKEEGMDEFTAFTTGMFSNIGLLAVTQCSLHNYHELYQKELRNAYESKDKKLHDALVEFDSSPDLLHNQLVTRHAQISADMVELMRLDRLQITEPIFDLAYATDHSKMNPIAQLVTKAKAYVVYRSLAKEELIDNDEAKALLSVARLTKKDITLLKKSDIDHIKLKFN
jgi:hypothetical protein